MEPTTTFNRAIISDILLWIALVVLLGTGIWFFAIKLPEQRGHTITVHFQDANEVSRGAIVRMMGTEIGYVDDIKLKQDHVDIIVKTYPGSLPIPSGSLFTVQFTGLVGSKSIEVVPPEIPRPTIQGQPLYLVEEPIRLKDMQKYQLDITQDLQRGAENIADFFGKKKSVEELQVNISDYHLRTVETVVFLDEVQKKIATLDVDLTASIVDSANTIGQFRAGMRKAITLTYPATVRTKFNETLGFMQRLNALMAAQGKTTEGTSKLQERLSRLNLVSTRLGQGMKNIQTRVAGFPLVNYVEAFNTKQEKALALIESTDAFLAKDHLQTLKDTRHGIQRFNTTLEHLNLKAAQMQQKSGIQSAPSNASSTPPLQSLPPAEDRIISSQGIRPTTPASAATAAPVKTSAAPGKQPAYFFGLSGCSSSR